MSDKNSRRMAAIALVILLFLVVAVSLVSQRWVITIQLAASAVIAFNVAYLLWKHLAVKPEDILLDLGRIEGKLAAGGGAAALLIGILQLIGYFIDPATGLQFLASFAFFTSAGGFMLAKSLSKVYATTNGIARFAGLIPWETITAYEWAGEEQQKLTIIATKQPRLRWQIPAQDVAALQAVLQAHATEANSLMLPVSER